MQYSEKQVIKMMEAYAELQAQAEALYLLSKVVSPKTSIGKRQHIQKEHTETALEIFNEDVPEEIRQKLNFKQGDLEKSLGGYNKEMHKTHMYYKEQRTYVTSSMG